MSAVPSPISPVDLTPVASDGFVVTPEVQDLIDRALIYLELGYPVHLAGPAGTGKSTIAFHLAALLGNEVTLLHGDHEFGSSDLVGNDRGLTRKRVVDNYIRGVVKTEDAYQRVWADSRLTTACKSGHTLVYDEFNRSRPEANNVLLSVLEEGLLDLPKSAREGDDGFVHVHPRFRAIFTSNPEEYAGTHKTQDALLDRMITLEVGHYDRDTEVAIVMSRAGVAESDAAVVVDVVRELRNVGVDNHRPTIRAAIAIARVLAHQGAHATRTDRVFNWVCRDVLATADTVKVRKDGEPLVGAVLDRILDRVCAAHAFRGSR